MRDEWCECGAGVAGHCQLCHDDFPDLVHTVAHLENVHGLEMDRWPDGQPVIVDTTLNPWDFG